jgi:hypothetical protein
LALRRFPFPAKTVGIHFLSQHDILNMATLVGDSTACHRKVQGNARATFCRRYRPGRPGFCRHSALRSSDTLGQHGSQKRQTFRTNEPQGTASNKSGCHPFLTRQMLSERTLRHACLNPAADRSPESWRSRRASVHCVPRAAPFSSKCS